MEESQEEGSRPESPAEAAHKTPLRRFRLGRFVLMLLFAAAAAACVAPALTSLVVAGTLVALLRPTEEIRLYLVFVLVAYAALTTAGLFEVWRARWVRRQWASSGASAASSAVSAPTA